MYSLKERSLKHHFVQPFKPLLVSLYSHNLSHVSEKTKGIPPKYDYDYFD